MTTSATSDTELLTEHFGYPLFLIDDIINSVNILAERALNSVEQGLLNAPPSSLGFKPSKSKPSKARQKKGDDNHDDDDGSNDAEKAKTEVEAGTHQLETLLCASIDRNFDKFEIYLLRNVLCVKPVDVRDWMRLSHYEGLDFSSTSSPSSSLGKNGTTTNGDRMDVDSDAPTLDSINLLRRKLRESMRLNAVLAAERARNEKMLSELRGLVGAGVPAKVKTESASPTANPNSDPEVAIAEAGGGGSSSKQSPFAFLHRKGDLTDGGAATPLSTTAAFTLSQMQALRALSTSLRNVTPDLQPDRPAGNDGDNDNPSSPDPHGGEDGNSSSNSKKKKSWRRERLEYVEGATRRHLETVQGLELGRHGEVRDGEWQGEGRGLARGEVEGLERMVGLLGGSAGGDDGDGSGDGGVTTTTAAATATATTPARAGRPPRAASASASRSRSARKKKTPEGGGDDGDGDGDKMDES